MREEIITERSSSVAVFFAEARELTEMIDSFSKNIRLALNGQTSIDDKELAQRLSLHRRTLQNFRNDNLHPYNKIGGKILYDEAEIETWLDANYHPKY